LASRKEKLVFHLGNPLNGIIQPKKIGLGVSSLQSSMIDSFQSEEGF